MARPIDHARRQELIDGAVAYAIDHGVTDLSLRPLAAAVDQVVIKGFAHGRILRPVECSAGLAALHLLNATARAKARAAFRGMAGHCGFAGTP